MLKDCQLPPLGWTCSRPNGHEGSCRLTPPSVRPLGHDGLTSEERGWLAHCQGILLRDTATKHELAQVRSHAQALKIWGSFA
jgi:hypothetical protein